jgi:hypothetical protein
MLCNIAYRWQMKMFIFCCYRTQSYRWNLRGHACAAHGTLPTFFWLFSFWDANSSPFFFRYCYVHLILSIVIISVNTLIKVLPVNSEKEWYCDPYRIRTRNLNTSKVQRNPVCVTLLLSWHRSVSWSIDKIVLHPTVVLCWYVCYCKVRFGLPYVLASVFVYNVPSWMVDTVLIRFSSDHSPLTSFLWCRAMTFIREIWTIFTEIGQN